MRECTKDYLKHHRSGHRKHYYLKGCNDREKGKKKKAPRMGSFFIVYIAFVTVN